MNELQNILQSLTKEEQQAVIQILQEQEKTGSSNSYNSLISADYDEIPISIEEFISNPRYAGNYLQEYYPFWKDQLINIFDKGKHYSEIAFTGSIGTGKVNSMETPLLGASGWFLMRDAKPGMKVFGEDGKLHTILKIWPNGTLPVYKVSFSDGSWVECGLDHNWTVRDYTRMKKQINKVSYDRWVTMTTKEIMDKGLWAYPDKKDKNGHRQCQRRFAIPVTQPIQFEPKGELPVHPYVLGQLLSDGAISTNSMYLHAYEEDVANKFNEIICQNYNCELVHDSNEVENYGDYRIVGVHRGINVLVQKIRELKLNKTAPYKYIPEVYLYSSVEDRIQLLQGLFDGDGSIQEKRYTYSTVSENLYKDMTFLIESLGGSVFRTEGKPCWRTVNGTKHFTGNKCWEFQFKLPDAIKPFTSKKHEKRYGGGTKFDTSKIYRFIDKIEYIRDDECQCITVDNPSGLYITKDFIVTHNSSMAIVGMGYVLYQLMCLKNPQKYWGTNKTMYFAFFNNNLDLAKSVGFAAFHDLIRKSDWFLENGEFRGKVNQVYHPYKDIELMAGSLPSHVIGKDVFCLTGDTLIYTDRGIHSLSELEGNSVKVMTTDGIHSKLSNENVTIMKTNEVSELIEIELEDGTFIRCTPNHKLMLSDGSYKCASDLNEFDDLHEGGIFDWHSIDSWKAITDIESINILKRYIKFIESRINRQILNTYIEYHHIIPQSILSNVSTIPLTAQEHFVAHHLLAKALGGNMWYALHLMCYAARNNPNYSNNHSYKIARRIYEEVRMECAVNASERGISDKLLEASRNYNNSMKGTRLITNGEQDKRVKPEEITAYLENGWFLGTKAAGKPKKLSEQGRKSLSEKTRKRMTGRKVSESTREKLRIANLGKTISAEQREAISRRNKGICRMSEEELKRRSLMFSGSGNPNYGKPGANTGKIAINRNGVGKYIFREELQDYLSDGWKRGRPQSSVINARKRYKSFIYKYENKSFRSVKLLTEYLRKHGYPTISDSSVNNIASGKMVSRYAELYSHIHKEGSR